jgi:hypothetical protein
MWKDTMVFSVLWPLKSFLKWKIRESLEKNERTQEILTTQNVSGIYLYYRKKPVLKVAHHSLLWPLEQIVSLKESLLPEDVWKCLETMLVAILPSSSGQRSGGLPNVLECTAQPTMKQSGPKAEITTCCHIWM